MAEAEGERTKYKAMIRYNARQMATMVGKDADAIEAELEPEWVASMALAMKQGPLAPTRLDYRFPNHNQAGACWCVGAEEGAAGAGAPQRGPRARARGLAARGGGTRSTSRTPHPPPSTTARPAGRR